MTLSIFQFYLDNIIFQGIVNLSLLTAFVIAITVFIMGPKKSDPSICIHPWFGKYTRNIPNIISYLRFPLGAWIFCVHYFPALHNPVCTFTFHMSFALVCFFDSLDGQFARKWNAITEDGKSLDPAADKWVTFCLAVTAYMFGQLRWWVVAIIFAREIISMLQRIRLQRMGEDVSAKWMGKIKTGVQFTVLYIILLRSDILPGSILLEQIAQFIFPQGMILWGMVLLCFSTIVSVFPYFKSFSYVNEYTLSQGDESSKPWYFVMIPNFFTIGNYLCGVTAVFFAMPEIEVAYRPFVLLFWILAAAFCDALDGPLARKLKVHSDFGACLDSSIDLSTFGLATAVVIFLRFSALKGGSSYLGILIALFYFVYVHLRLARFTVRAQKQEDKSVKSDFVGLPSPSGAIAVLIAFTFFEHIQLLSVSIILISLIMYSKMDFISHSNSVKHPFYKYFVIPFIFFGFIMLLALLVQLPFINHYFSRELIVYFNICSWIFFSSLSIYILDAVRRTYFKTVR